MNAWLRRLFSATDGVRSCAGVLALATALSGCGFTYHFKDTRFSRGEEHHQWASFFLFGLVGDHEVDVREFCGNGVHEITTGDNFLTWLVTVVTLGIYTPRKVNIWCSGTTGTAFRLDIDGSGRPTRLTKREGTLALTGTPRLVAGNRWQVDWEREEGVEEAPPRGPSASGTPALAGAE